MVEELEQQSAQEFNLQKYLGIARRRHWHFLIPLFVGWLAVWGASWVLPARYKSGTLILVEQPSMPKDYVTPNISDDLQARLASITQQILSRTRLLHIIDELNLYAKDRSGSTPDDLVDRMRKDIEIELVRDERQQVSSFNVYYSSYDPHVAQQVTSELTNLFISENLELRQQKSEDTTKFLESQLEAARQTLAEQEEKVRVFKDQHLGELPTQLGSNLQILSGLQSQLQNEEDALNAAKQQNAYLQSLMEQYRALQRSPKTSDGTAPIGLPAIDQQLDKLKTQLADLSSHYTDRHPDVRKVKEQIAKTEQTRDKILADLKNKPAATTPANTDTPAVSQEDVYLRESSPMLQLQGQMKSNQIEITNREHDLAALKAKINEYQGRLNQEPVREQQFADLTRGYEQSKANYDELLKKKNESEMATSMELRQEGEHFRMIDPPSLPAKPDFPNRLKLCGMGLGIGLALGAVFAGGAEFLDDRLYGEKEIKDLLPIAIISEIPDIANPEDEKRQRRKLWLAWVTAGLVLFCILAGSAFSYLRG
jgi:polysaccharide biosynthesis transport protein